jgi:exonuclease SbcC
VNVIFGQSDKGKTAIIRALRWAVFNKPSGDLLRSNWGGDTEVEIVFNDGTSIQRKKTNTENSYSVNGGKPLKAFGQGVPDTVVSITNLEEVNIQQQMDSPFLLSETSGEVATHFNRIAGISIIDTSISKAKKEVASIKANIQQWENDYTEKLEIHKSYIDLDKQEEKLKALEVKDKEKQRLQKDLRGTLQCVKRLKEIKEEKEICNKYISLEPQVYFIFDKQKQAKAKELERQRVLKMLNNIRSIKEQIQETRHIVQQEGAVKTLLEKVQQYKQKSALLKALKVLAGKHTTLTKILQENAKKVVELTEQLPEICPTCKGTGKLK